MTFIKRALSSKRERDNPVGESRFTTSAKSDVPGSNMCSFMMYKILYFCALPSKQEKLPE